VMLEVGSMLEHAARQWLRQLTNQMEPGTWRRSLPMYTMIGFIHPRQSDISTNIPERMMQSMQSCLVERVMCLTESLQPPSPQPLNKSIFKVPRIGKACTKAICASTKHRADRVDNSADEYG
jgi:hypothetical protein